MVRRFLPDVLLLLAGDGPALPALERWGVPAERLRTVDLAACELDAYSAAI